MNGLCKPSETLCSALDAESCIWCEDLTLKIRGYLYHKETRVAYKKRLINDLIFKRESKHSASFKEAIIDTDTTSTSESLSYKTFDRIVREVKSSITSNAEGKNQFCRFYFDQYIHRRMKFHQDCKRSLRSRRTNCQPKFKIDFQDCSTDNLLQDPQLKSNFDFKSVSCNQEQCSDASIERLQKSIMLMVGETLKQNYLISPFKKFSYLDFLVPYSELKFKKKLCQQLSSIQSLNSLTRAHQRQPIKHSHRMHTSPALAQQNNDSLNSQNYQRFFRQKAVMQKKSGKSKLRLQQSSRSRSQLSRKYDLGRTRADLSSTTITIKSQSKQKSKIQRFKSPAINNPKQNSMGKNTLKNLEKSSKKNSKQNRIRP